MVPPVVPFASNADPNLYGVDPNEFLCNGYDRPPRASVADDDGLGGLNPSDVVAHYTTIDNHIDLATSNPVCLYAPRFSSVRHVTAAAGGQRVIGLAATGRRSGAVGFRMSDAGVTLNDTTPLGHAEVARSTDAFRHRNRGVPVDNVLELIQYNDVLPPIATLRSDALIALKGEEAAMLRTAANAAVAWTNTDIIEVSVADVAAIDIGSARSAEEFTRYDFPDAGRLEILKLADRADGRPGDVVTFTVTVRNVGDSEITRIHLADNLDQRLRYIDGSQDADTDGTFAAEPNDAGGQKITWTFDGPLAVGEVITIRFRAEVL